MAPWEIPRRADSQSGSNDSSASSPASASEGGGGKDSIRTLTSCTGRSVREPTIFSETLSARAFGKP